MNNEQTQAYYAAHPSARWLALLSVGLALFVTTLTLSAVNVAIPAIAKDLQANALWVSWIPAAFLLSNVVLLLPAGRLADVHGRKRIFTLGSIIFSVACIIAYTVTSIEWLLVTRLLQGVGTAMIFATGLAIVISIFETGGRGVALGVTSACVYLGLSLGPLVGGWLTEFYSWRSVFLFQVPIALTALAVVLLRLKGDWKNQAAEKVDWLGSFIFGVAISALFIGISLVPSMNALVLILAAVLGLLLFVLQQSHSTHPLIRFRPIMKNRVFSRSLIASLAMYAGNYPLIFLLSLYLQFIQHMTPSEAGQLMLLQAVLMALISPLAGRLSDRYEPRILASSGCLIVAVGYGILQQVDFDSSIYWIATGLVFLGVGFALFSTPNNNAALSAVHDSKLNIASALLSFVRTLGNMVGTAIVLMLMALNLGSEAITPEQYPALLLVIRWGLAASFLYAIAGAYFSHTRGNTR